MSTRRGAAPSWRTGLRGLGLQLLGLQLLGLLVAAPAAAEEDACRSAYVETQRLQRAARFRAARREAVACGQDRCSETVRSDCIAWLSDIERALPTLLIDARDANGEAVTGLRIEANGEVLVERWDGRALELDPGEYTLRIQQGERSAEAHTTIREAEKYRMLEIVLAARSERAPAEREYSKMEYSAPPLASYVLGGLSLGGLATFALLGASGYASERALRERCAGECSATEVDSVQRRYLLGDMALGVGAAAGIAAVAFWIWAPERTPGPRAALGIGPRSVRVLGEF